MTANIIEIQGVRKEFKQVCVLKDINLSFEQGKLHALIGRNGSGKSMLLKCISGLIIPTSGKVFVSGEEVGKKRDFPQNIGLTIDISGFLPYYSGLRNLQILASIRKTISKDRIHECLAIVGLEEAATKKVSIYSTGMKQRLSLAQAIMENPDILLLDEPMNGLDQEGIREMRTLFQRFSHEGKTVIMATHNKEDIDNLCDTVVEMERGEVKNILRYDEQ